MALTDPVRVDRPRPRVVRATLCAADVRNRLDDQVLRRLGAVLDQAESDSDAEVLLLRAEGPDFCAGLSLGDLGRADWRPRVALARELFERLARSPLVTVALVDGSATGGGVGLAAACDQVVLGPRGRFRLTEVLLGLIPAIVLPVVARRVGGHRAYTLALTAREVAGPEAVHIGLADECAVDPEEGVRGLLVHLRSADRTAVRALKRYRGQAFDGVTSTSRDELIDRALEELLTGPAARDRLARFSALGMLP